MGRVSVFDGVPDKSILSVRIRTQDAYRGGRFNSHDALDIIKKRIIKAEHAIENSINNHQYSRVKITQERLSDLAMSLAFLQKIVIKYGSENLVIRMNSGKATKLFFSNGDNSWVDSPARVMFAFVHPEVRFESPRKRDRKSSLELIGRSSGISVFNIKK
ncbi:hypothetical protein ABT56_19015 [Photobacterium aquae]|uniref:Uncharacterized protein n=2 Tax=Photobacterium aquae TaxID=1195763 RepID=A0A0J1GUV2_9GAMM|nr:hypothetical protein ABT56_19015 [Photobacterium aquae]